MGEPDWCVLPDNLQDDLRYGNEDPSMAPNQAAMAIAFHGALGAVSVIAFKSMTRKRDQGVKVPIKLAIIGFACSMLWQVVNMVYYMWFLLPCLVKAYVQTITFTLGYAFMVEHVMLRSKHIFDGKVRVHPMLYHVNNALLAAFIGANIAYFVLNLDEKRNRYGFCDFWPASLYWPIHTIQWIIHSLTATIYTVPALRIRRRKRFRSQYDASFGSRIAQAETEGNLLAELGHAIKCTTKRLPCAKPFGRPPPLISDEKIASLGFRLWFPGIVSFPVTIWAIMQSADFPYGTIFTPIPELLMFSRLAMRLERDLQKHSITIGRISPDGSGRDAFSDDDSLGKVASLNRKPSSNDLRAHQPALGVGSSDIRLQNVTHAYHPSSPGLDAADAHRRHHFRNPDVSPSASPVITPQSFGGGSPLAPEYQAFPRTSPNHNPPKYHM